MNGLAYTVLLPETAVFLTDMEDWIQNEKSRKVLQDLTAVFVSVSLMELSQAQTAQNVY